MVHVLLTLGFVLMIVDAAVAWLFVLLYSRVRWYGSEEGRHLMRFTLAVALLFSLSVLFIVTNPNPLTRGVVSVAVFGWIAAELANRIRLHLRARRENRAR